MPTLRDYINAELDAAYKRTAGGMLKTIESLATAPGSRMQARLAGLEAEAARLAEAELSFTLTNADVMAALDEVRNMFKQTESVIMATDNAIQDGVLPVANSATKATVSLTIDPRMLPPGTKPLSPAAQAIYDAALIVAGIDWVSIDRPLMSVAANYVDGEAWIAKMEGWGTGTADRISDTVMRGIAEGRSPIALARDLRHIVENMPVYASERLTRTLQLTTFRDAERLTSAANSGYIAYKVRNCVKDQRTCLSCIGLDGTKLKPDERVDDHFGGRCFVTYVLTNGMGDTKRETGEQWFNKLSPERQAQQSSFVSNRAKYEAWKAGEFKLSDVSGTHTDDVFGKMTFERSLKDILGVDRSKEFYTGAKP